MSRAGGMVFLNDKLVPAREAAVSVFDRGFLYGDGLFETMRAYNGHVFLLKEHLQRLKDGAEALSLPLPWTRDDFKEIITATLAANHLGPDCGRDAVVRVAVSRGWVEFGAELATPVTPTLVVSVRPVPPAPATLAPGGLRLTVSSVRRNPLQATSPLYKTANFLNNVLARIEAGKKGFDDSLMLNMEGRLTEATTSNLFLGKRGVLYTPPVTEGLLPGTMRALLLHLAARDGIEIKEEPLSLQNLAEAEEIFLSNSVREIIPVAEVDGRTYEAPGPFARKLYEALRREIAAFCRENSR